MQADQLGSSLLRSHRTTAPPSIQIRHGRPARPHVLPIPFRPTNPTTRHLLLAWRLQISIRVEMRRPQTQGRHSPSRPLGAILLDVHSPTASKIRRRLPKRALHPQNASGSPPASMAGMSWAESTTLVDVGGTPVFGFRHHRAPHGCGPLHLGSLHGLHRSTPANHHWGETSIPCRQVNRETGLILRHERSESFNFPGGRILSVRSL